MVIAAAETFHPGLLIVEDDVDIRDALADLASVEGFQVDTAANGREALRHLALGPRPHLILLDLLMPEMNGWQFRQCQLRDPSIADIPVVVLSAMVDGASATLLGVEGFVRKPFGPSGIESLRAMLAHYRDLAA